MKYSSKTKTAKFLVALLLASFVVLPFQGSLATAATTAKVGTVGSVSFASGNATLSTAAKKSLDGWVATLKQASQVKVTGYYVVPGATAAMGTNRANAVVAYLKSKGVTATFSTASATSKSATALIAIVKLASTPTPSASPTAKPTPTETGAASLFIKFDQIVVNGQCTYTGVRLNIGGVAVNPMLSYITNGNGGFGGFPGGGGGGPTGYCQGTVTIPNAPVGTFTPELTFQWPSGYQNAFVVNGNTWYLGTTTNNSARIHYKNTITITKNQTTTIPELDLSSGMENSNAIKPDPSYSAAAGNVAFDIQFDPTLMGSNACYNIGGQIVLGVEVAAYATSGTKTVGGKSVCVASAWIHQMPVGTYSAYVDISSGLKPLITDLKTTDKNWTLYRTTDYSKSFSSTAKVTVTKGTTTTVPTLIITK